MDILAIVHITPVVKISIFLLFFLDLIIVARFRKYIVIKTHQFYINWRFLLYKQDLLNIWKKHYHKDEGFLYWGDLIIAISSIA